MKRTVSVESRGREIGGDFTQAPRKSMKGVIAPMGATLATPVLAYAPLLGEGAELSGRAWALPSNGPRFNSGQLWSELLSITADNAGVNGQSVA